jgi:hypothetical protein
VNTTIKEGKGNCVSYSHASGCIFIIKKLKITLQKIDSLTGICCSIVVTVGKIQTTRNFMNSSISQNEIDNEKNKSILFSFLSICYLPRR